MGIAKYIATRPDNPAMANQRVYEMDPPVKWIDYVWDDETNISVEITKEAKAVIVSAANVPFSGPETYIFPAHKEGDLYEITDWMELDGSYRGGLSHEEALNGLGYEIA